MTGGVCDKTRNRGRPEIAEEMKCFLVYTRALNRTGPVDEDFEVMLKCLASLPQDEWVPCKGGERHLVLGRFEEVYSMITRERQMRGSWAAFEAAVARYKGEWDEVEEYGHEVGTAPTVEGVEMLKKKKEGLEAEWERVLRCAIESIETIQDCGCSLYVDIFVCYD